MGLGMRDLQWLPGAEDEVYHLACVVAERVVLRRVLGRVVLVRQLDGGPLRHRVGGSGALAVVGLSEAHFVLSIEVWTVLRTVQVDVA